MTVLGNRLKETLNESMKNKEPIVKNNGFFLDIMTSFLYHMSVMGKEVTNGTTHEEHR